MTNEALNDPAEIPPELDRWNWGAFFLNWIWGIGNSTWIALIALIPAVPLLTVAALPAAADGAGPGESEREDPDERTGADSASRVESAAS